VKVEIRTQTADGTEDVKPSFTNCRAQVQLKGTDRVRRNQDTKGRIIDALKRGSEDEYGEAYPEQKDPKS
jgi:hypothetical protein